MREILLLPYSLHGEIWESFTYWSNLITESDTILTFSGFAEYAEIAGIGKNYNAAISAFSRRGIRVNEAVEDCFDAYLLSHINNQEIYLTPTSSTELVVASAIACGYEHNLFALAASDDGPQIKNLTFLVKATKETAHAGRRSLDTKTVDADHTPGSICHYTVEGRTFQQVLPTKTGNNRGEEGYVIPAQDSRYCLKIWDNYHRPSFSNEKIAEMIRIKDSHPNVALPRAFVFNEKNKPIGICMPYFNGRLTSLDRLNRSEKGWSFCKEILSHLIWLQTREILHQDIWHNIMVSDHAAYTIDLESAQYLSYPATAASADITAYIPSQFTKTGMYHSTIEQSYTALAMLILLFFENKDDLNRLLWDRNKKKVSVNRQILSYLPEDLQVFVIRAYEKEMPVSLMEQYRFMEQQMISSQDYSIEEELESDDFRREYSYEMQPEEIDRLVETAKNEIQPNAYAGPMPPERRTVSASPAKKPLSKAPTKKSWFVRMLQLLIIRLFGSSSGTIIQSYGEQSDPWEVFIRSKAWKKPLVISVITVAVILIMLIALAAM